ncbi:MAG: metallophosphoesterase [Planctomycetota bacterium]|nr:metallophosphoesterase [Planctomycetota bacterium]
MKIAWATDIHLHFVKETRVAEFCSRVLESRAEALLIGGDIAEAIDLEEWLRFLDQHLERPIYFVLGNHDYYRGDISTVRNRMRGLKSRRLHWLPHTGLVRLTPSTALVGHGGWGDARLGEFLGSPVILNDYLRIEDLRGSTQEKRLPDVHGNKERLQKRLGKLGDDAAATLRPVLSEAARDFSDVIVLTHVPPFREACWHEGKISDENWLPGFTCKAMGDMLLEVVSAHPNCNVRVLCGHTHGSGEARILPNLHVRTGGAEYGDPRFELLDL